MSEATKTIDPFPGDLEDLLKSAFAAALGKMQSQLEGLDLARFKEYVKSPAPRSTHQRVSHALNVAADPDTVTLTREQIGAMLKAAYPLSSQEERQAIFDKVMA